MAALNHPHICHLYDVGPNYLVMEYVEGAPLKGPMPIDQILKYAEQIQRPEVKVFEIGVDSQQTIEKEMQKHKSGFTLDSLKVVAQ